MILTHQLKQWRIATACFLAITTISACKNGTTDTSTKPTTSQIPAAEKTFSAADFDPKTAQIVEGKDYTLIKTPQKIDAKGKIEVREFFWYGCPHCYHLEPALSAWRKHQPAGIDFVRTHVDFVKPHQRAAFAVAELNKSDMLDPKFFESIQANQQLTSDEDMAKIAESTGIAPQEWQSAYKGFNVNANIIAANEMAKSYGIEGVPTFVINGKYQTSPTLTQSETKLFQTINYLVAKEQGSVEQTPPAKDAAPKDSPAAKP